ncbi:STAS domain-containing protein [Neobacillus sp. PS3-34]|uniref:STAS domain-containing protein n=1 Tax=Neobacillus sp. PS3-34 TaxID=3070678 RepID=UPI0027E062D6|nr:STAS domain-containing protein [Neobacillus sp. PS3-34]WML48820.1 STAS domain-containing protein [Neobacillus sp. PS3-34]
MPKEEFKKIISDKLAAHADEIVKKMLGNMMEFYNYQFKSKEEEEKTAKIFLQCVHIIAEGLRDGEVQTRASSWGETIGVLSVESGAELGESIKSMTIYKKVIWAFVQQESLLQKVPYEVIIDIIADIDHIFNLIVFGFSNAFTKNAKGLLKKSEELYLKISVPIVPISKTVAILPLVGEITETRSEILITDTLNSCVKNRFETLVIDLSGVYEVDLIGIEVLYKLIRALNLLGVSPMITGMRAEISQTFTQLGIYLDKVVFFNSLEQALQSINLY